MRLGLENALVLARSTSRTLVLPPPQTYYLFGEAVRGLDAFLPALVTSDRVSVVTAKEFVERKVPRLIAGGLTNRYRRPASRGGGRLRYPPPANATGFLDACHPTHKASDSCFGFYEWLEESFGRPDVIPDVGVQCVVFGRGANGALDGPRRRAAEARIDAKCGPRTSVRTTKAFGMQNRTRVVGEAVWGTDDPVLHMRSSGQATHYHEQAEANRLGRKEDKAIKPMEPNRLGRLLAPFYSYVVHADPEVANFYKRLVLFSRRGYAADDVAATPRRGRDYSAETVEENAAARTYERDRARASGTRRGASGRTAHLRSGGGHLGLVKNVPRRLLVGARAERKKRARRAFERPTPDRAELLVLTFCALQENDASYLAAR